MKKEITIWEHAKTLDNLGVAYTGGGCDYLITQTDEHTLVMGDSEDYGTGDVPLDGSPVAVLRYKREDKEWINHDEKISVYPSARIALDAMNKEASK